jgi:mono/diheme cytochrome c family protein
MRPPNRGLMYRADPMVYAFIAFWVLLGLAVFFVAMRGGPRGARESLHTGNKLGQRAVILVVVLAFAFGLVVPVLVLTVNGADKASAGIGGVHLNAEEQHGRVLFSDSCAFCHTLAGSNAVGRVGPNLDIRLGSEIPTEAGRRALVLSAIAEGRARGNGDMPAGLYQGHEAEAVADFVAAVAGH